MYHISQDRIGYAVRTNTYILKCRGLTEQRFLCCLHHRKICVGRISLVTSINSDLEFFHLETLTSSKHRLCSTNRRGRVNQDKEHELWIASAWKSHRWPLLPAHWPELGLIARKLGNSLPDAQRETKHKSLPLPQEPWALELREWFLWHLGKLPSLSSSPWFHIYTMK